MTIYLVSQTSTIVNNGRTGFEQSLEFEQVSLERSLVSRLSGMIKVYVEVYPARKDLRGAFFHTALVAGILAPLFKIVHEEDRDPMG